jgi:Cys-tRNA(Pro) deacylase
MKLFGEAEVRDFLSTFGLVKEIHTFAESTENAFLAAKALGVQQGQIVKSVIFLADGDPVLVLMSGDMNVHTTKLRKFLRAKKVKIADPETVMTVTGYPVGAVPPVAHRKPMATYLDESLKRFPDIYPAAGSTNNMFPTTFEELMGLTAAKIIDVATPKKKP